MSYWPDQTPEKPAEKWVEYKDYNPDRQRSSSMTHVEDRGADIVWLMQVKGLGALLMRAGSDPETGRLDFYGVSQFTDAEIGHRK
jgi:hypothetical protein